MASHVQWPGVGGVKWIGRSPASPADDRLAKLGDSWSGAGVQRTAAVREPASQEQPEKDAGADTPRPADGDTVDDSGAAFPAAWELTPHEFLAAGEEAAAAARDKHRAWDKTLTSRRLDGIADNAVLTFEPASGSGWAASPARWRYEDLGRYVGENAVTIDSATRDSFPDWKAASATLHEHFVTAALEGGAEPPGWLPEAYPELAKLYGTVTKEWSGGNRYEGEVRGGEPHGQGAMTYRGGSRIEGEWRHGRPHGRATWTAGEQSYEGEWRDGKPYGQGIVVLPGGRRFEGEVRDQEWVRGIETTAAGHRYEGEFLGRKRHGHGVLTKANNEVIEGEWKNGKQVVKKPQTAAKKTRKRAKGRGIGD